jgi:hypothetical protein
VNVVSRLILFVFYFSTRVLAWMLMTYHLYHQRQLSKVKVDANNIHQHPLRAFAMEELIFYVK